jgi:pimeloyl-ACP methyl ester carboxylesterase
MTPSYQVQRAPTSAFMSIRGLRYHALHWGDASLATPTRPPLVMVHGWMDVAASFQFVVDALFEIEGATRWVIALDWRGFGLTQTPAADCYWFPDYLGDLDAALDAIAPGQTVDLLGHSMGGNIAMTYAGVRPQRIRKLINLEGFGMPRTQPSDAPERTAKWLDELRTPLALRPYPSLAAVAQRLRQNNPLLSAERAAWLAPHWARQQGDGQWQILGDPAHKRSNPVLHQVDETLEYWKRIAAPVLWVEGERTRIPKWWAGRYSHAEFDARLGLVANVQKLRLAGAGHMLHHEQPQALAQGLSEFLGR